MRFDEINQALHKIGETTNQEVPLWCVRCGHKATRLNAYGCEGCNKQRDRERAMWHSGFYVGVFWSCGGLIVARLGLLAITGH